MKTDELIALLAADARPVDGARSARHFAGKLAVAPWVALALVLWLLGPRPDLAAAAALPMFWVKLALPAAWAAAAWLALRRLGHPGTRLGQVAAAAALALAALWLLGGATLLAAAPGERVELVMGRNALECLLNIGALSVPSLVLAFWALRGLAPTRLALAGAAAGLFAGSVAGLAYALHCPELEAPFLAVWYVIAMALPAAAGALLGPRWLRW